MAQKNSGYSGSPLAKKLGLKDGFIIRIIDAPDYYYTLFESLPEISEDENLKTPKDFIHVFATDIKALEKQIPKLKKEIKMNGMIWVSWPKKSSGIVCNISNDMVRECILKNGLVDSKICSVDETWSGLRAVIRLKDRE